MNRQSTVSKLLRRFAVIASAVGILFSLSACGESAMSQKEITSMDTAMTITAYGKNRESGINAAVYAINSLDSMLDPSLSGSAVYSLNHAQGSSTVVSGQIAQMISTAKTIYSRSSGALDLTIYPLVKLWGFSDRHYYVPDYSELEQTLERLCFDQVNLSVFKSSGTYSVTMPSYAELTFASMARGCASENAIEALRSAGVESALVSMSGNVQTLGLKPDGSKWNIAIQDPNNTATYLGVLSAAEIAVSTTGGYQNNFTDVSSGTYYHHIINPVSGYPTTNSLVSATVICDDGTTADALSTAMYVLGESRALNYWRTYGGFEMILVTNDNRVVCTSGLIEQFTLTSNNYTLKFSE